MTTDICTEDVIVQLTSPQGNNAGNRLAAGTNGSEMGRKLLLAAKNGDTNTVLSLMAAGAPFSTDWLGTSALHLAAGAGHAHTAAVLLRAGSVRDARTKVERTPLHVAASGGHSDVVTLLLQHGAAVDCRDMLRMTPLHWAAQRGHAAAAAALLAARADHTATDKFGHTAAALAARAGHAELAAALALAPTTHHTKPEKAESNLPVFESVPKVQEIPSMPEAKKAKPNPPSEGIKIKPEPGIEFFNTGQEAGVGAGAGAGSGVGAGAALLARHGITLQPRDQHCTVLSALRCGRSLVLSDAGKLVLKESAAVSSSGAESAAASLQQAAPPPAPAPAPSPHNKLMFSPTHNLTVGNVQVKYVQIPKDTKIISPRKEVMIKAKPRPMLVNYNQLCSSNKKEMLRQPVKIIMNKANFKKLISNKNTTALNVVESGSGAAAAAAAGAGAGAAAGADSGQLRAELAAARVAIARLTHELANARDQLAHRHS